MTDYSSLIISVGRLYDDDTTSVGQPRTGEMTGYASTVELKGSLQVTELNKYLEEPHHSSVQHYSPELEIQTLNIIF